jgi:hypothetical protein
VKKGRLGALETQPVFVVSIVELQDIPFVCVCVCDSTDIMKVNTCLIYFMLRALIGCVKFC